MMITGMGVNFGSKQFDGATFGDLSVCNFELARFEECVFTGTVYGCNFMDVVFSVCSFATAVFNGCNFTRAQGVSPENIVGENNNFGGV